MTTEEMKSRRIEMNETLNQFMDAHDSQYNLGFFFQTLVEQAINMDPAKYERFVHHFRVEEDEI